MNEFMCNVVLPLPIHEQSFADALKSALRSSYGLSVVFGSVALSVDNVEDHHRVFFVRLSAQVYLELSDFVALATGVLQLLNRDAAYYKDNIFMDAQIR